VAIAGIWKHAHAAPDKVAVVHDGTPVSYGQFARWIEATRRYLAAQGAPPGCVAIICVGSLLHAWVLLLALRALGLTTVAIRSAAQLRAVPLRNVGVVVTSAAENPPDIERLAADSGCRLLRVPVELRDAAATGEIPGVPQIPANGCGHILLTSGTTGDSKKVFRDAAVEALAIPARAVRHGISDDSVVYVSSFGPWTAGGYRWSLMPWSVGGTVVLHQGEDLHQPLVRHSLTHIFATPQSLHALMWASKGQVRRNDATRLLVTGGAMSKATWMAARQGLTRQVSSMLASTEALLVSITPIEQPEDLQWHRLDPAREVQVVDAQDRVLSPGQEGHVRIRIDDGLPGYLDDEAATRACFRDGYFYPGDLALFGSDGRLSLRGRASDVVNVLGIKVATGGIEQALQDRLGVEGVCILPVANEKGDDEMHLVIQSGRRIERAEFESAADAELGAIKRVPVHIEVVPAMPRNDMGKIDRRALREQLMRARAARAPPRVR
jgi:acyl-coenzyme A synthetase/AMP-(fatty) acid ligase